MRKIVLSIAALLLTVSLSFAEQPVRFGVPPWPGVTVKTEVVTQIMNAMGYQTEQLEVGPPIIYKALTMGQMDAYLAAWLPHQNDMLNPLEAKGEVEKVTVNLDNCNIGLCVPDYVWEAGIRSFKDLDPNSDKFKKTIYNIEAGTGMNNEMSAIIEKDVAGLGDWEQMASSTSAMLSQVKANIRKNDWIAFGCWNPHWMTIEFNIRFLEGVPGTEGFTSKSTVYTVASKNFHTQYPELHKFLKQFQLSPKVQSQWIYSYGYEEIEPKKVARDWIGANLDTVKTWLKDVKAKDGKPAIEAVKKAFQS